MRKAKFIFIGVLLLLLARGIVLAAGGDYDIGRWVTSSGGGEQGSEHYTGVGVIGQPGAGRSESENFVLEAGFLTVVSAVPQLAWESYQTSARTEVWGDSTHHYDSSYHTAYMRGEGFTDSHDYKIGYYDGSDAHVSSAESASSNATGVLDGAYDLTTDPGAATGTWHSVVFNTTGSIPDTYAGAVASGDYVIEDDFIVDASAIPEFPTVIAGIGVAGLCLGIYYWMRKRKQRQVATA